MERWFRSRFSWPLRGRFHREWRSGGDFSGEAKRLDLSPTFQKGAARKPNPGESGSQATHMKQRRAIIYAC